MSAYDFKVKFPRRDAATVAFVLYPPPTSSAVWFLRRLGYFDAPWFRIVDIIDTEGRRRQILVFPRRR
jgi:hypothetical protein